MNLCQKKYKYLGNPCRFENSKIKKKINNKKFNILIVGGSLGAKIFNEIVPQAIHSLKKMTDKEIDIIHQTGKTYKIAADQYKSIGIDVDVKSETVNEENVAPSVEVSKEETAQTEAATSPEAIKKEAAPVEETVKEEQKSESPSEKK